jgi:hypothetical protein
MSAANAMPLPTLVVNLHPGCDYPNELYDLLQQLLILDPLKRLTATAALKHPFLQLRL